MSTLKRELEFDSLDQALDEARELLNRGYITNGNWNLSQVCAHLSDWLTYPVKGFPKPIFPIRFILWTIKKFKGKAILRQILSERRMQAGQATAPESVWKPDDMSDAEGVEKLAEAIKVFENHTGEYLESPIFGNTSRDEARQLQLVHCAHHLGFLTPED